MSIDRKSTRLNSSHLVISYAVFCLKKKKCQECFALPPEVFASTAFDTFATRVESSVCNLDPVITRPVETEQTAHKEALCRWRLSVTRRLKPPLFLPTPD